MSSIILPPSIITSKQPWRRQPQTSVEIDTRLFGRPAWVINASCGAVTPLGQPTVTNVSGLSSTGGIGYVATSPAGAISWGRKPLTGGACTLFGVIDFVASSVDFFTISEQILTSGSTPRLGLYANINNIGVIDSGYIGALMRADSANTRRSHISGISNGIHSVAISWDGANEITFAVDGVIVSGTNNHLGSVTGYSVAGQVVRLYGNGGSLPYRQYLSGAFNRKFSRQELIALSSNPWQIFRPIRKVSYSFPSIPTYEATPKEKEFNVVKTKQSYTKQPQSNPKINWSNPITRNLEACVLGSGVSLINKLQKSGVVSTIGTPQGLASIVAEGSAQNTYYTSIKNLTTGPLTDFALVNFNGTGSTSYTYACGTFNGTTGVGIATRHTSATPSNSWGIYDNGGIIAVNEAAPTSGIHLLVHARDANTNHRVYRNGKLLNVVGGSNHNTTTANWAHSSFTELNGTGFGCPHPILMSGRFSRQLSDAEVKSLSDNPWQLFQYLDKPIYLPKPDQTYLELDDNTDGEGVETSSNEEYIVALGKKPEWYTINISKTEELIQGTWKLFNYKQKLIKNSFTPPVSVNDRPTLTFKASGNTGCEVKVYEYLTNDYSGTPTTIATRTFTAGEIVNEEVKVSLTSTELASITDYGNLAAGVRAL